jgi:Trk K+ transport system NAD-binding subunit
MVVPRGHTQIEAGDKLMFLSAPENQKKIISMFTKEAK